MKVRIIQVENNLCEIEVKKAWYSPWKTVYDGCLPWRGSYAQAVELKFKILKKYL